eukprot:GEMP01100037.1.p1 GENE.GEMP01100037.1~~GEMP01100037.1.p1  ORF type:complete len:120 (+),score=17.70 GEMP01100037.1:116-475(+)
MSIIARRIVRRWAFALVPSSGRPSCFIPTDGVRRFSNSADVTTQEQRPVTAHDIKVQRQVIFPRATEEDGVDRDIEDPIEQTDADASGKDENLEYGFKYLGPEPTVYGDWAHKGRVTDF